MRHWYDLTCPFCYLAQSTNEQLVKDGVDLSELPFQAHPDMPDEGMYMGPRRGMMYDSIEAQARAAGLPLKWQDRMPNSRLGLAVVEWVRRNGKSEVAGDLRRKLFHAHFAAGRDIGSVDLVLELAVDAGVDKEAIQNALQDGSALNFLKESQREAEDLGVQGTPAWEEAGKAVFGMQDASQVREMLGV